MHGVTTRLGFPSARTIERGLAVLLLALLATYALGTVASGAMPAVHTAGVVAVHLAVVVGLVFPVVTLLRAAVCRTRTGESRRRIVEVGTAITVVGCLALALALPTTPIAEVLLGVAAGGALLLAGLVVAK